ncbi:hypothetical protein RYX36_029526 [Vicia faba]
MTKSFKGSSPFNFQSLSILCNFNLLYLSKLNCNITSNTYHHLPPFILLPQGFTGQWLMLEQIDASGDNLDNSVVSSDSTDVEKSKPKSDQNLNTNGVPTIVVPMNQILVINHEGESFKREMRDLEELLSKLNPLAEEFVPLSLITNYQGHLVARPNAGFGYRKNYMIQNNSSVDANGQINRGGRNHKFWLFVRS